VHAGGSRLAGSGDRSGGLVAGVGVPLAEVYLEFLGGRCRPNTVLAAAYDLRVFFAAVAKPPDQVRPADVLAFITAQRTGRTGEGGALRPLDLGGEPGGVSAATVRRRLSIVSGFFAFLQARGDVAANPAPRDCRPAGSGPVPARVSRWCVPSGGCRGFCPPPRWMR
jgi:site-specific recombinase XerD